MTVVLLLTRHGKIDCPGCMHPSDPPDNRDSDCIKQQQYIRHCQWSRCRCMITYHMRCPENGDTQRQAVEPGKPLSLCAGRHADLCLSERFEPHLLFPCTETLRWVLSRH